MPQVSRCSIEAWAASGAMALTGPAGGPALGPPEPLVPRLSSIGQAIAARSGQLGRTVDLDVLALLGERAAIAGLHRNGATSCGGATRLLRALDGWIAVALPRPDDIDFVPAWLETDAGDAPVEEVVAMRSASALVERAAMLGLAVSRLGERADRAEFNGLPCSAECFTDGPTSPSIEGMLVVDLSALWAGPLCGSLLALAGAAVVKVESTGRPDGARQGPQRFFDLMNGDKQSLAVDFTSRGGRNALAAIIGRADVVIEGSRPRALEQLGIDAIDVVRGRRPKVWVSITGYGRSGADRDRDRVAFGDDAAVAGGLVAWNGDEPCFCADAVADPITGLVAAAACLEALAAGGSWMIDVAMSGVAAHLAGATLPVDPSVVAAAPRARSARPAAPALGADTGELLERWDITA